MTKPGHRAFSFRRIVAITANTFTELSRLKIFVGLNEEDEKYFNEQFATVTGLG